MKKKINDLVDQFMIAVALDGAKRNSAIWAEEIIKDKLKVEDPEVSYRLLEQLHKGDLIENMGKQAWKLTDLGVDYVIYVQKLAATSV